MQPACLHASAAQGSTAELHAPHMTLSAMHMHTPCLPLARQCEPCQLTGVLGAACMACSPAAHADDVFDVGAVRSALDLRLKSLESELHQVMAVLTIPGFCPT